MKRRKLFLLTGFLSGLLLLVNACYYDQIIPEEPSIDDIGPMSFSADIIPIFEASCNIAGCHNGTVTPDLRRNNAYFSLSKGNYINTSDPQNSELYQWMNGNRAFPMPLIGPNPAYNQKVLAWITQGALNN